MSDSQDNGSIGTSLITFLLGVAVGATVAILYAPAAGTETRAQLADKATQLKDKAGELKDTVSTRANEWKEKATTMLRRGEDNAMNAAESVASEA